MSTMTEKRSEITSCVEAVAPENYRFCNEPTPVSRGEQDRYLDDLRRETAQIPGLI